MTLTQLTYVSRPSVGVSVHDVEDILAVAREHNREQSVTGFLVFRHDLFVQVLEGGRAQVSELFVKIAADPRHRNVELIGCHDVDQRRFADWSMGFLSLQQVSRDKLLRYSGTLELDFAQLSHAAVVDMMADLAHEEVCAS